MTENEIFCRLGWMLIEWKLLYYREDLVHPTWREDLRVPDATYDKYEDQYKNLAKRLNKTPTATDMVDFDPDRAACRLVIKKFSRPKRKTGNNKPMQIDALGS